MNLALPLNAVAQKTGKTKGLSISEQIRALASSKIPFHNYLAFQMAKETCLSFGVILKGHSWQWLMRRANKINAFPSKFETNWNRLRKQGQRKWKSFSATIRNSLGGCSHRVFVVIAVESLSCNRLFVTPWTAAYQASLSFTVSRSLLKLMTIEYVIPSNHVILFRPLLLLPSVFPSIHVF